MRFKWVLFIILQVVSLKSKTLGFSLSLTQASSCLTKSISFNLSSLVKIRPASYSFDVNFLSLYSSLVSHQAGAYTSFNSLKRLGAFSPPPSPWMGC